MVALAEAYQRVGLANNAINALQEEQPPQLINDEQAAGLRRAKIIGIISIVAGVILALLGGALILTACGLSMGTIGLAIGLGMGITTLICGGVLIRAGKILNNLVREGYAQLAEARLMARRAIARDELAAAQAALEALRPRAE